MIRKTNFLVCASVFALLFTIANDEATAQPIAVNPADPSVAVGETQQFRSADATATAPGDFHTCALLQDGTARCWGNNSHGQLGRGDTDSSLAPVAVLGLAGGVAITSGGAHSCALLSDGMIECWGANELGQLGNGTTANAASPVRVSGIANAVAVSAGYQHTCAVLQDGTIRCWGDNTYGQLGDGSTLIIIPLLGGPFLFYSTTPVSVSGISTAVAVASSTAYHTCAVLQDGTARCWGDNSFGQLGDGTTTGSTRPVTVRNITNATAVSGGDYHTCARLQDAGVSCWGLNYSGQLGNGSNNSSLIPVSVSGISTAVTLAVGFLHTCASLQDGTARCWGHNEHGQLGNGTTINSSTPVPVRDITTVTAVTSHGHSCASLLGGSLRCWGANANGQVGDATNNDASIPVAVSGMTLTWTSSDATIATIDSNGLAAAHVPGVASVTATLNSRSGTTGLTVPGQVTLAVVTNGDGGGAVTSSPPGIDCGTTCSASYDAGTLVTLTAAPAVGSILSGWTGCDSVAGTTCSVIMNRTKSATATFTLAGTALQ